MKNAAQALIAFVWIAGVSEPAHAAPMAASCARVLGVSDGEASFIYYRAEVDLGAGTANRLWNAYHRLKARCASHPSSQVVVNVEPRVKAFLESYR